MFNPFSGNPLLDLISDDKPFSPPTRLPIFPQRPRDNKQAENIGNVTAACNPAHRLIDSMTSMSVREAQRRLPKGDHIKCNRVGYSHHGIYDGNGHVYEYNEGIIRLVSLSSFADGDDIVQVNSAATYSRDEIIRRARSRLGECNYNLLFNNCEHYARWCRNGNTIYMGPLF